MSSALDRPSDTVTGASNAADIAVERELPRVIVAFHARQPLEPPLRLSLGDVDEVHVGRGTPPSVRRIGRKLELVLDDHEISRSHVILRREEGGWELRDCDSKNGTRINGSRIARAMLVDGDFVEIGGVFLVFRDDAGDCATCADLDLKSLASLPLALRSMSLECESRFEPLLKIAASTVPVFIHGETGTGKELTARAIHQLSGRDGAFVAVNCGAIPRTLIESELFGSKRGAFSGARDDREGLVRTAEGGTLFLDEIAELPVESQVALLRVLQEGEVRPVGAAHTLQVDVRVVAATHQDIEACVDAGTFRRDLYARLIGYIVTVPPLRSRREDLGMLIGTILARVAAEPTKITFEQAASRALLSYPYPLNIRELEQALRAAVALGDGEIRLEHLPEAMRRHRKPTLDLRPEDQALRDRIRELLAEHRGNVTAVGRGLGKAPIQVRRWCRRFQIDIASFRR